jgi:cell division control protein 12
MCVCVCVCVCWAGSSLSVQLAVSWKPVVEHIEAQSQAYLNHEMRADRSNVDDGRVHVALYFIEPTGHSYVYTHTHAHTRDREREYVYVFVCVFVCVCVCVCVCVRVCVCVCEPDGGGGGRARLKALDVVAMRELGSRVNLIPVIAKADTVTPADMAAFKQRVRGGGGVGAWDDARTEGRAHTHTHTHTGAGGN